MSDRLGFYEILEPYFTFGLAAKNVKGAELSNVRDALIGTAGRAIASSLSGPQDILAKIVTDVLDYLSVEELHSSFDDEVVVYRGFAQFGGEGRANPEPPTVSSITSAGGHELSWLENRFDFRLTVPRRSGPVAFDTTGLTGADLTDLQQLNTLLNAFTDDASATVSDLPGSDFRLELLVKTVRLTLPEDDFLPARVASDGWLEPDPSFEAVVLEFPTVAFILEQQGEPGNLNFSLRSWDAAGFDDPGDTGTGRLFTVTPPFFLHSSRCVGFGIERLVADFSDDVTPAEILEQFGIGDDFNGFWLPLIRIFIAPGRTTGLALSARGKDLLFDFDKGLSGEIALDILNRGGQFNVEPIFYSESSQVPVEWTRGTITRNPDGTTNVSTGNVSIPGDGEMHLSIRGSISPYRVTADIDGGPFEPDITDGINRPRWLLPAPTPLPSPSPSHRIGITVKDRDNRNTWNETIVVTHVTASGPGTRPSSGPRFEIRHSAGTLETDYRIEFDAAESVNRTLVVRLVPDLPRPRLMRGAEEVPRGPNGKYRIDLTPGEHVDLEAFWDQPTAVAPVPPAPGDAGGQSALIRSQGLIAKLYFRIGYPIERPRREPDEVVGNIFSTNPTESFFGQLGLGPENLRAGRAEIIESVVQFLNSTQGDISVSGFASKEIHTFDRDDELSRMRAETLSLIIERVINMRSLPARVVRTQAYGHLADDNDPERDSDPRYRTATATAAAITVNKRNTFTADLVELPGTPVPAVIEHPPEAAEPERPSIFRRIGIRVRFERDKLVLGEISGQFDFVTQAEEAEGFIHDNGGPGGVSTIGGSVSTSPGASQGGEQGILDYRLTISYDTATRRLTEELALGFDRQSRDGWVKIEEFEPEALANTLGSLLVFAPLLNAGIDSAVNASDDEAVQAAVIAAAEIVIAAALGATGMLKFKKFTLFGIELSATQLLPDNQEEENTRFSDLSALFDYAVDFEVDIDLGVLMIKTKTDDNGDPKPIRIRYRGFGFRLNFQQPGRYEAVFDTSKGFELGLAEPGALEIGGLLGSILRVDSVRVARQNPLILELDLGLNANLGVIEVETVRVRVPIDGPEPRIPTIIPTGISVNVPSTIVGTGFLDMRDDGFAGAIDVTLVPLKLRMQASVGLENLKTADRRITAFFLGIGVEFPSPIPLANSGLGLYGLLGLFGMHYKRNEEPPVNPNLPIALDWFYNKAKGEPNQLIVDGRRAWIAAPDRWSFGVGAVLGTMEGAFIINLKGMLVLELPGPRILVFVKAQILESRPPAGGRPDESAGILAVIDLNFQVGYIAIGLIFNYEIRDLLRIEVPIDSRFNFRDIEDWHLYIGSLRNKASARILGIVKGTAYLMFDGRGIPDFPLGRLNGFSIAAGIAASIVIGDESSGLYAKVAGALDAGVSTDPIHFFGRLTLEGSIHLWFVSIGASARLDVEAPEPLFIHGQVCGSIDLWFTEIEGCVGITIGSRQSLPNPPALIAGLSLQSHSPALTEGQATDRPIDTSLGVSHDVSEIIPDMPLDVIPVLQMRFPPVFGPSTGLRPSTSAPTLPSGGSGWVSLGGVPGQEGNREVRYEITALTLSSDLGPVTDIPITWWQPARPGAAADSQATDKGVNLALNSWIPVPFPRSYQRSRDQVTTIRDRFERICRSVAPPAAVLWTFNAHFTVGLNSITRRPGDPFPGYSASGWRLTGAQWPDPPETTRATVPGTVLHVHEPDYPDRTNGLLQEYAAGLTGQILDFAKVIPPSGSIETAQVLQFPFLQAFQGVGDGPPPDLENAVRKFLELAGIRERIVVESGDVVDVRCLISANREHKVIPFMRLRGLDAGGNAVEEINILPGRFITNRGELPAPWRDSSGPWFGDVERVFAFFGSGQLSETHNMFLVEWKPAVPIARFELSYEPGPGSNNQKIFRDPPAVMLGVVETVTREEEEREPAEQRYHDELLGTVVDSLEQGDNRPLLAPDTIYTVTASYTSSIRNGSETKPPGSLTQRFRFRTTAAAPHRLDPWVLAGVPENDDDSHFVDDDVQIIFNDRSAIRIFSAFGKTLKAVLLKSNGNHPPEQPVIDESTVEPVQTVLRSPYAQTMGELAADLPCVPQIVESEGHRVFTLNIVLERGTSYVLDIKSVSANGSEDNPVIPLFRTSFTTSRFLSAREMAGVIEKSFIGEMPLRNSLALPLKPRNLVIPDDAAPNRTSAKSVQIVTDAEMESALRDALGSDLPPARQPGLTMLWSAATPSRPLAVLVDSSESLLRTRAVPVEVSTPAPDGDFIQHFQMGRQLWLELVEAGSTEAERIVFAAGGCRALVFLRPGATGRLRLALRQYRHTLLTSAPLFEDFSVIAMTLPDRAPWEI